MITREARRFVILYVPFITAILLTIRLIRKHAITDATQQQWKQSLSSSSPKWAHRPPLLQDALVVQNQQPVGPDPGTLTFLSTDPFHDASQAAVVPETFITISSSGALKAKSQKQQQPGNAAVINGKHLQFTPLVFGGRNAINPNVLPHPTLQDTYIIVGQEHPPPPDALGRFRELSCNAAVNGRGELACVSFPVALSIEPTTTTRGDACEDPSNPALALLQMNQGPHDARVFFGPGGGEDDDATAAPPLVVYGSNSGFTCFGQWVQDFAVVGRWEEDDATHAAADGRVFTVGTEMQRPKSSSGGGGGGRDGSRYYPVEKNFFVFWDRDGVMHAHHDMYPVRTLGRLSMDGGVDRDLGPETAEMDGACMARFFLPRLEKLSSSSLLSLAGGDEDDSLHQSTNSLAVTMCRRDDADCNPGPDRTFVLTVVHHKRYRGYRSSYEAYAVLFRQSAPFALHAISKRPLWISGRRKRTASSQGAAGDGDYDDGVERLEMFYMTSLNWMRRGQRYHGYLDDVILAGFGIDDATSAVVDVTAGDLLEGLGFCNDS